MFCPSRVHRPVAQPDMRIFLAIAAVARWEEPPRSCVRFKTASLLSYKLVKEWV